MAKEKRGSIASRLARWRLWVQAAFLPVWLTPMVRLHNICSPVFHCYSCPLATFACPIGVIANFSAIHVIPFVAIGTIVAVGAVFGSFICGWVCPFGFLQDLIGRIPTRKFVLPAWMGYSRYAVLLTFVVAIPYMYGEDHSLFFCRLCPAGAVEAGVPNMVSLAMAGEKIIWLSVTKTVILGLFLLAVFFTWRPWCTLFCPLGAIFGLCNYVSLVFLRFHPRHCKQCNLCRSYCNYRGRSEDLASTHRCIRCLNCTQCDAVSVATGFYHPAKPVETQE